MPRAFDNALRARVITACLEEHVPACKAAKRFGVSVSTATKWVAKARRGQVAATLQGCPRGSRLDAHADFLTRLLDAEPHLTVNAILQRLREHSDLDISYPCLYAWLRGRGWQPGAAYLAEPRAAERQPARRQRESAYAESAYAA